MGDLVIFSTEAMQKTLHPAQKGPCREATSTQGSRSPQDDLQAHHDEDFPRMLVTSTLPTYSPTPTGVLSTEEWVALRTSFTRSL